MIALDARLYAGHQTGDSTYWTGLIEALVESHAGLDLRFFSDREAPMEAPAGVRERWVRLPARSGRWWSWVTFPLAARRAGAKVTHTQYALSPLAKGGVTTVHDISFLISPEWFRSKDRRLLTLTVPASMRRARAVVTVSETSRKEIVSRFPNLSEKTHAIWNGPNTALSPVSLPQARQRVEADFGLSEPYVLSVSTRWPRKNMGLAVAAMEGLPKKIPHQLVLTGKSGWGDESVGPRTVTTGFVRPDQLSALYAAADLYLCPSFHEGFGLPLVEAFGLGCPVLSSVGGALPEVGGEAAEYVADFLPETWTRRIQELLENSGKLAEMRQRGLERARLFSWSRSAQAHAELYRRLTG